MPRFKHIKKPQPVLDEWLTAAVIELGLPQPLAATRRLHTWQGTADIALCTMIFPGLLQWLEEELQQQLHKTLILLFAFSVSSPTQRVSLRIRGLRAMDVSGQFIFNAPPPQPPWSDKKCLLFCVCACACVPMLPSWAGCCSNPGTESGSALCSFHNSFSSVFSRLLLSSGWRAEEVWLSLQQLWRSHHVLTGWGEQ